MKKIILLFLACFITSEIFSLGKGGTSASFLKIGVGAKNIALGETGATSNDVNSIYWNPAGLSLIKNNELSFMHAVWLESVNYEHLALGLPTSVGNVGFAINYLFMNEMEKLDNLGQVLPEKMTVSDLAVSFAYSRHVYLKNLIPLNIGINLKYLQSKLDTEQATSFATDIGLQYKIEQIKTDIGFAVQNIGAGMKFINRTSPLPQNIKLGVAHNILLKSSMALNLLLDLNFPNDNTTKINFGTEYEINLKNVKFMPRVGFKSNNEGFEKLAGITGGLGVNYKNYAIDYAFVPYGELGDTHRVSLNISFVPAKTKKEFVDKTQETILDKQTKESSLKKKEQDKKSKETKIATSKEVIIKHDKDAVNNLQKKVMTEKEMPKTIVDSETLTDKELSSNFEKISASAKQEKIKLETIASDERGEEIEITKTNKAAIYFTPGSAKLDIETYKILLEITLQLKTYPYETIEIVGYVDGITSKKLAQQRTESIANFFIKYQDINKERIVTKLEQKTLTIQTDNVKKGRTKYAGVDVIIK